MFNEKGSACHFSHDSLNRLTEEVDYSGQRREYRYDAQNRLVERVHYPALLRPEEPAQTTTLEWDALNRLTGRTTGQHHIRYRHEAGRVTAERFILAQWQQKGREAQAQESLTFIHDHKGRLTGEVNHAGQIQHRYDALDNLLETVLPAGEGVSYLYYGSGHALSISLDERLITEFTRDNLHREISRTQGGLTTRTRYDRLGRQARRDIYCKENGMRPVEAWHWQYDSRHNLLSETQISDYRYQGYHYDDGDRVCRHDTSFRGVTHHTYDAAGNLLTASQAGLSLKYNR